ncbi:MAG: type II secretion system protein [Phycisphaerales bacterium]|nr:type II secretion system protein [Phycisphaerales bacterium]
MRVLRRRARGFTLIELLVVIGIIALLVSILVPSLKRARVQARDIQCRAHLHAIYLASTTYLSVYDRFPDLNNELDDGAWQYNYLIYDGRDFDSNFGPLISLGKNLEKLETLYCPRQTDPYHSFATPENPWPVVPLLDTRASYGRRYNLTGKSLSQLRGNPALFTDVFHLPKLIRSGHRNGINAAYLGGDVRWVPDTGFLTDNELTHPFQPEDNDLLEDMWDKINRGAR